MDERFVRLVEVSRGPLVECVHQGAIVVADARGGIVHALGEATLTTYPRSALKPFQALPLAASGALEAFGWGEEELALACASHSAEAGHVGRVATMLASIGCTPADLQCGCPQRPPPPPGLAAPINGASPLQHNCSGKHTGFLALCRHQGWPTDTYLDPAHPAQQLVREAIAEAVGVSAESLVVGVDGCSAPAYAMPLTALARGYAVLAEAATASESGSLRRIVAAMTAHPWLVAGSGRADTAFMSACPGRLLSKGGADGIQAFALPGLGLGVAIKIADGNALATQVAGAAVLEHFGLVERGREADLAPWRAPAVRNARGLVTGAVSAVFELPPWS